MPLVTNPFLLYDLCKVWGIASLSILLLATALAFWEGSYEGILFLGKFCLAIFAGFMVLSYLIMLVVFRNRWPVGYRIDDRGILMASLDRTGVWVGRIATVTGALAGRRGLTTSGAGLLSLAGRSAELSWKEFGGANFYPRQNRISLLNSWRVVVRLEIPPDRYRKIESLIRARLPQSSDGELRPPSAAPFRAIMSLLVIAFGISLLGGEKPLGIPAPFTLISIISMLVGLWSGTPVSRTAGTLGTLSTIAPVVAAWRGGQFVHTQSPAWEIALLFEFIFLGYFVWLGLGLAIGRIRTRPAQRV